jgi:hypothetical protein
MFPYIDCGGPGSFSQLLMMKEFMSRIAYDLDEDLENIRPADFFDLIGGTGFGAYVFALIVSPIILMYIYVAMSLYS